MATNNPALLDLPDRPVLLDGGMGRELQFRGVTLSERIWSAQGLILAPHVVRQIHEDYIAAGADIITTNTYGIVRDDLARVGMADRFTELNQLACRLAHDAAGRAGRPVWVAGSLPPLRGSFRPDLVGPPAEIVPCYRQQTRLLAPHVDLFICETMSSGAEALAAAKTACETGRPVWVSWTLHEDESGRLRSGETINEAASLLADLPVSGFLVNCCSPKSVTRAISLLTAAATGKQRIGGYANTFHPIPADWRLDGEQATDGLLPLRNDLDPKAYAAHADQWLAAGATVIGGCCGTRPAHIRELCSLLSAA